jgi:hypothetical protein
MTALPNPAQLRAMARPAPDCMPGRHCERHKRDLGACIAGTCNRPKPADTGGLTPCHPMRDGYTGSTLTSAPNGHRLTAYYATREQADAAHAWLADGVASGPTDPDAEAKAAYYRAVEQTHGDHFFWPQLSESEKAHWRKRAAADGVAIPLEGRDG